jgi:coenzyme F420-dependent glucose-6-phosphate dehydrogenase
MTELGYFLSSEEHKPNELVTHARLAEEAGFEFVIISDHFHPWTSQQGQSSFVWSVLGGIARATKRIRAGTGVTCPTMRFHPVLAAQASATIADMMPGRFFLGLGTGEYLNEHIYGHPWPDYSTRREMLIEAVHIIREMWKGDEFSHNGIYYIVKDARLFTLPEKLPPLYIAASGPDSASLASEIADGLISTTSGDKVTKKFKENGGSGKPCFGQIKVCWAETDDEAKKVMQKWWPVSALTGRLHTDLPTPSHFEDAVKLMGEPDIPGDSIIGPKTDRYLEAVQTMQKNGFDHIYLHQVGPDQEGFLTFFKKTLLPALEGEDLLKESARV